jgi:integrase
MPRRSKGAHLWLRPARRQSGRLLANAVWIIVDGKQHIATGCFERQASDAEQRLAEYIAEKYRPMRRVRELEAIDVADVLLVYLDDCGPRIADKPKLERCIGRLNEFWGGKTLSDITSTECRAYVKSRGKTGGARSDLETLRAAINHHAKENLHYGVVRVALPPKGAPRDRWLTRAEAAHLLWTCWRYRETQTVHCGLRKGDMVSTVKRPLRHLARFILIGLYTGTRAGAISSASPYRELGHSFVDIDQGIFYRQAIGRRASKKRQPPAPIPMRLLAHMRRWVRQGVVTSHFVEWNGAPVKSVKTAFNRAVRLARLWGRVTPHTLRHTAATWLMQRGVPVWQAAGFLGMSAEILEKTYGHHHPDYLKDAADAITSKTPQKVSLVVSLVEAAEYKEKTKKRQ